MLRSVELPQTFQVNIGAIEIATVSSTAEGAKSNALYWLAENAGSALLQPFLDQEADAETVSVLHTAEVTARLYPQHANSGTTRLHGIAEKLDTPKTTPKVYKTLPPLSEH